MALAQHFVGQYAFRHMPGLLRSGAAAVLACAGLVTVAHASPPETYPLSKVHRGQTGYGITTMAGQTPERFTFEVVSVVHNFLPKQDIILVKTDDPKITPSGFWHGMSGSPLYIDDKLVCAFSYAWPFSKTPIGGCTPIEYMKRDGEAIRRSSPIQASGGGTGAVQTVAPAAATLEDWRRLTPRVDVADAFAALGPLNKSWLASAPLPRPVSRPGPIEGDVVQASIPLSISGFSAPAFGDLTKIFADSNLVPMRAGGASSAGPTEGGPQKFVMGGPISVELVRGDFAINGTGTVSYIDGNKLLAFGHPMFQTGESYAPVATASVHTVIPSAQSAFVMATAMTEAGSLVQDRQSSIMADTNLRAPMIPVDITIATAAGTHKGGGAFHVEVLSNKFLTPSLTGAAIANAINYYLPDRADVTAKVESTLVIKVPGQTGEIAPIRFVDYMYANDGAGSVMAGIRGLRALVPLMLNPYAPLQIERLDIKVDLTFESNFGEVKELSVPTADLIAGERNLLHVRMSTWDGRDIYDDVPLDVPLSAAGSIVQVELSSGDSAKLDAAPPVDLPSLLAIVRKLLPGDVWAATMYPADEGVAVEGKLVRDLPASALDKLHPQSHTQRAQPYRPIARTLSPARRVIAGGTSMLVRVRAR